MPAHTTHRLRLFFWLFFAGLPGVAAVAYFAVPILLAGRSTPVPVWLLSVASGLQSCVLLTIAVWAGVSLAPTVGLRAPAFQALASFQPVLQALRPQAAPGILAGLVGAIFLIALSFIAPPSLLAAQAKLSLPLVARLLYGGITEELLLRWGLMSALLWLLWRLGQRAKGTPHPGYVVAAIVLSAVLFGVGHLPAASVFLDTLSAPIVIYVVLGNAAFGVLAGYLFWRHGLESAIIAHAVTHFLAAALGH